MMAPSTPRISRRLASADIVRLGKFLETVCRKVPDTEFCEYLSPWDDEAVSDRMNVTKANVAGLRKQLFGDLRPATRGVGGVAYTPEDKTLLWDLAEWATSKGFVPRTGAKPE